MNEDKLKELVVQILDNLYDHDYAVATDEYGNEFDKKQSAEFHWHFLEPIVTKSDLITAYRQLEKAKQRLQKSNDAVFGQMTEESDRADKAEEVKTELLSALKPFHAMSQCFKPKMILAQMAGEFYKAGEVYTKHSTDTEVKE